ncbi:MAG: hypothetical protein JXR77_14620, partial [Lentisphaeria bacterium]|nr:hypothetical protein [Lentisphaeria bacterium]
MSDAASMSPVEQWHATSAGLAARRRSQGARKGKEYTRYLVRYNEEDTGKRTRRTFGALAEARRFAEQCDRDAALAAERQTILEKRIGEDAAKLTADHLRDAVAGGSTTSGPPRRNNGWPTSGGAKTGLSL